MPVGPNLAPYWRVPKYRGPIVMFVILFILSVILFLWGGGFRQPRMLPVSIIGAVAFFLAFAILIGFVIIPSKNKYPT